MFPERLSEFLATAGDAGILGELTPDASTRAYYRIDWRGVTAIACVYPPDDLGLTQFRASLDVTGLFLANELPVARIFAASEDDLVVIHEDFGDRILRDVLADSDETTRDRFLDESIRLIARIQAATASAFERDSVASRLRFDVEKLTWELQFFLTHYFGTLRGKTIPAAQLTAVNEEFKVLCGELEARALVLTHRDFHAANLMLEKDSLRIIDHQDARIGTASYDLVSLLLDRVTELPTPEWLAAKRDVLLTARRDLGLDEIDPEEFATEFRLQTVQRCLKAIGTFSFQSANRGKTHFTAYINPMFAIVLRAAENLKRFPALEELIRAELSDA